jgi:guanosine-3',5'-bis(diphosphate) 3'-pyrophosphohydrolase
MKEITLDDVVKKGNNLSRNDIKAIKKAYNFALKVHKGQKRKTGEPYIQHLLYTAYYIADLGIGKDALCAALLHDVLEDTNISETVLKKEFNNTIFKLVSSVTKLKSRKEQEINLSNVENLRKFFIVAARDIRAVIIKLADRLHNTQTIEGLSKERQKTYAKEIKYIFSTLADYLGIGYFKRQFDDLSFKTLNPQEYKTIEEYLSKHHRKRHNYVERVMHNLKKFLSINKVKAKVEGREKSIYSIYKKLQRYLREGKIHSKSEYGKVYDNYGFRILVNNIEDCYKVLGIIHSKWHPIVSEFEDYIANPKPNGYKSLHTTIFCENNKIAEVQIKTHKMHDYNEFGPASHIAFKLSGNKYGLSNISFNWLRKINIFKKQDQKKQKKNPYKIDVFKDNIFVLTPESEVKKLPVGATSVDFAYSIHTDVGNKCRGAKVNGKLVSLDHELHTGDQVEIIIDKNVKYPISKWLEFTISQNARRAIKHALREKEYKEAIEKGYRKLNESLKPFHTSIKKLYKERGNDIDILINKNNTKDFDGLLASIGFDLITTTKISSILFPREKKVKIIKRKGDKISIEGSTQTYYSKALCCKPKNGDGIIALTTVKRGIRIHKADCGYTKTFNKDKILEAHWI